MNKKKLYLIVVTAIIILAILYFPKKVTNNSELKINKFKVIENNADTKEDIINYGPINENEIDKIKPFEFSVITEEVKDSKYNLLIEDVVDNNKEELILNRKYLHYELYLNNIAIKNGLLSDIRNNIIDTRTISKNKKNNYSLKIWLSLNDSIVDLENKYYSYNIIAIPAE